MASMVVVVVVVMLTVLRKVEQKGEVLQKAGSRWVAGLATAKQPRAEIQVQVSQVSESCTKISFVTGKDLL